MYSILFTIVDFDDGIQEEVGKLSDDNDEIMESLDSSNNNTQLITRKINLLSFTICRFGISDGNSQCRSIVEFLGSTNNQYTSEIWYSLFIIIHHSRFVSLYPAADTLLGRNQIPINLRLLGLMMKCSHYSSFNNVVSCGTYVILAEIRVN